MYSPRVTTDDDLRELLGDLVQANGRMVRVAARLLADTPGATESPAVWRTLAVLAAHGPLRVGELAAHSRVAQPTMTKLVGTLVERGHVLRVPDPNDARATTVAITDEGTAAYTRWRTSVATALAPFFRDLSPEDLDALRRTVRLLAERVELDDRTTPRGAHRTAPTHPEVAPQ